MYPVERLRRTLARQPVDRVPVGPVQEFLMTVGMIEHDIDQTHAAAIARMLDLAAEAVTRFGLAQLRAGANILQVGESLASASLISLRTSRRFVLIRHQRIFGAWKAGGPMTTLYVCGKNTPMLDLWADTGADVVASIARWIWQSPKRSSVIA